MRIGLIILASFLAAIIAFILLVITALGSTKVITSGSYGPFTIGEEKQKSAATLERLGLWPPTRALPPKRPRLEAPELSDLLRVFGEDEGVMVFLGLPHGSAMRLEFEDDILTRIWPKFAPRTRSNPNPGYDESHDALFILQGEISIGMSRREAFDRIANDGSGLNVFVSAHVAGEDLFRQLSLDEKQNGEAYSDFVYSKSGWQFRGLDHLVWYSVVVAPHYSTVRLFFENEQLLRIEHFHGPIELP